MHTNKLSVVNTLKHQNSLYKHLISFAVSHYITHITPAVHFTVFVQVSSHSCQVLLLHMREDALGGHSSHLQRAGGVHAYAVDS